jgi:hypothetical protein
MVWADYGKLERSTDAWLIEAGEPSVTEKRLKVGVQVYLVILRVHVLVQASTVVHVSIREFEVDSVD